MEYGGVCVAEWWQGQLPVAVALRPTSDHNTLPERAEGLVVFSSTGRYSGNHHCFRVAPQTTELGLQSFKSVSETTGARRESALSYPQGWGNSGGLGGVVAQGREFRLTPDPRSGHCRPFFEQEGEHTVAVPDVCLLLRLQLERIRV